MDKEGKKEMMRVVKFGLFSISAGIIEAVSFELLNVLTTWDYWPKYLIALVLSIIWNFTMNRTFTFRSANNVPVAMLKVAAFYVVFTPVSTIGGQYLAGILGWNETLVLLITMACNFVTEYLYDRFIVFGKSVDTNKWALGEKSKDCERSPSIYFQGPSH